MAIQNAVKYRCAENSSHKKKVATLRSDIVNSVKRLFGDRAKIRKDSSRRFVKAFSAQKRRIYKIRKIKKTVQSIWSCVNLLSGSKSEI